MELIYRGVKYNHSNLAISKLTQQQDRLVCQQKSSKTTINLKFPWFKYCQQLFTNRQTPILRFGKFWHQYQVQHLENCWHLYEVKQLNSLWELSSKAKLKQVLPSNRVIKLKYRGVTYYKPMN